MRFLILIHAALLLLAGTGCKSSSSSGTGKTFCDTACLQDTLRFAGDHPLQPYVTISVKDCKPENIERGHQNLVLNTGFGFENVHFNKEYIRTIIDDTSAAYILFNDCMSGRGYYIKLPFNKTGTINKRTSAINNLDKKYAVDDHMVAYIDKGNIFVEETRSGKKAMMTFGKMLDIDYDATHEYLDSVNVTPDRIWVRVKIDNKWEDLEKKITLE